MGGSRHHGPRLFRLGLVWPVHDNPIYIMRVTISFLTLLLCPAAGASPFQAYVQSIGSVGGGYSSPVGVSDTGETVAVTESNAVFGARACSWTEASGLQPLDSAGFDSYAFGISGDGSIISGVVDRPAGREAAIWNSVTGQRSDLGLMPGHSSSSGDQISGDGSTVAGNASSATSINGFRWNSSTGMQNLGSFGGLGTYIKGISHDGGVIVGASNNASGVPEAFVWTAAGGMQSIPGIANAYSIATDVSDDGLGIVGTILLPGFPTRAFYHHPSVGTIPITVPAGLIPVGPPLKISGDGLTVTGVAATTTTSRGFVWSVQGGGSYLDPVMALQPSSINYDGSVVVGSRTISPPSGPTEPFRWNAGQGVTILDLPLSTDGGRAHAVNRDGTLVLGVLQRPGPGGFVHPTIYRDLQFLGEISCSQPVPNSTGAFGSLRLAGTNLIGIGSLTMEASGIPVGALGLFLVGSGSGLLNPVVGSQGSLCLGGSIGRFRGPGQVLAADASGRISVTIDTTTVPSPSGPAVVSSGQRYYFQAWHRDLNPNPTSNFTSAVALRFF